MAQKSTVRSLSLAALLLAAASPAFTDVFVQCPGDINGDAMLEIAMPGVICQHLAASDGFVTMADGRELYIFGFTDVTGVPADQVILASLNAANLPGPPIMVEEGDQLYLSLTNVGFLQRPDLPDAATLQWGGFPVAAPIFNGEPESSVAIIMGSTLTYFYQANEPGTFTYRGLSEPAMHVQMGELGTIIVHARQSWEGCAYPTFCEVGNLGLGDRECGTLDDVPTAPCGYAYDDSDGSTRYDLEFPVQMSSFDAEFHDSLQAVQPAPYDSMQDDYAMLNGRGYPDTIGPQDLPPPAGNGGIVSQRQPTLIEATAGQRVLLRIANLSTTRAMTLASLGLPMRVVGRDARLLRGPTGLDLSYTTGAITLGSGQTADAILDTAGVAPGRYVIYDTRLNHLSNDQEDYGGMMTELIVNP